LASYGRFLQARVGALKRLFDLVSASLALLLLFPVLLLVAWLVHRRLGSPVLFRQVRPGLHGKPFEMVKFRTMRDAVDTEGNALPDAERLTPFGRFLRSTSLDELPELWNVIKGDMSLVGPRPLLMEYLSLYSAEHALGCTSVTAVKPEFRSNANLASLVRLWPIATETSGYLSI